MSFLDDCEADRMKRVVSIVAETAGDGFLRIGFKQNGEWMKPANQTRYGDGHAYIVLQYPRQGEMVRHESQPSATEQKAIDLDMALEHANELLTRWCS